jgi:hypothetical protein
MVCTKCGFTANDVQVCAQCGNPLVASNSGQSSPNETSPKPGSAPHRPPTPPIPSPPVSSPPVSRGEVFQSRAPREQPSMNTADRLSATGKVVGLSGCLLTLLFWVVIPLGFLLLVVALSSSTGLAIVVSTLGLTFAFFRWVWRRNGT